MGIRQRRDIDNDDEPVGRLLTRGQAIALGGAPALAFLAGCSTSSDSSGSTETNNSSGTVTATPMSTTDSDYPATGTMTSTTVTTDDGTTACVAMTELTEGPYYVDENLRRSDIQSDTGTGDQQEGIRLDLDFTVHDLSDDTCEPLENAIVDVWNANVDGVYSDVQAQGTVGKDFLRGIQSTDENGGASFTTIYPGWYPGMAVHIHFKIRSSEDATDAYGFTSQLFFDDDLTDKVYAKDPYSERDERDTRNADDNIFQQGNASHLLLDVAKTDSEYSGTLDVALYKDEEVNQDDSASGSQGGRTPPNGSAPGSAPSNGSVPPNGSAAPNETTTNG